MNLQPNIIMIVSDQHRADWMGNAGSTYLQTPNLDRLSEGGVRFTNAYCNSPLCVPSRMSMLTGRYPSRTGVYNNEHILSSELPTFAHALGLAGYDTVLCGRMHFKGPDQRHGYSRRLVGDITPTYNGGPTTPYGRLKGTAGQGKRSLELSGPGDSPVLRYDETVISACEQFLAERIQQAESERLFLTVGLYGPHPTFICPPELYDRASVALKDVKAIPRDAEPLHPWVSDWFDRLKIDDVSEERTAVVRASYAGLIHRLDTFVGRVMDAARALPGDTIIVYVSDHGEMAGDHGMFWKQSFYEGSSAVPMIWYPLTEGSQALIAEGRSVHVPVSLVDLAPTLVQLSGAPEMPGLDGRDLSPLMKPGESPDRDETWNNRSVFCEWQSSRMIRSGPFKLNYYDRFPPQLFNLEHDPQERQDLYACDSHASIREELLNKLKTDWNPDHVREQIALRKSDIHYLTQWGKEIGFGRMDMWETDYDGY